MKQDGFRFIYFAKSRTSLRLVFNLRGPHGCTWQIPVPAQHRSATLTQLRQWAVEVLDMSGFTRADADVITTRFFSDSNQIDYSLPPWMAP